MTESNIKKHIECPMRHENGNCLPSGGFCTAVNACICEAIHNAYYTGKCDALCKKEDLLQLLAKERQQYYDELQMAKAKASELRHLYEQAKYEQAKASPANVRHGYWKNTPPYTAPNGQYLKAQECSVCFSFFVSDGNTPYSNHPYCCECGAKMDGKEGDKE